MKNSTKFVLLVALYCFSFLAVLFLTSCSTPKNCCGGKKSYNNYKPNTHKTNFTKKHYSI